MNNKDFLDNSNEFIKLDKDEDSQNESCIQMNNDVRENVMYQTPYSQNQNMNYCVPPLPIQSQVEPGISTTAVKANKVNSLFIVTWIMIGVLMLSYLGLLAYSLSKNNNPLGIAVSNRENIPAVLTSIDKDNTVYTASGIYKENIDSIVAIQTEIVTTNMFGQRVAGAAAGSGFVISEEGYILTNAHVVDSASSIKVMFENGEEYTAKLVGKETENDVAVLKVDTDKKFKAVILGNSDNMVVGEDVVAIGNPLGELTFSMTKGIISALDRTIQVDVSTTLNMFQVDCSVNEGNSGGPIFNMYGEVIGIVSAKYASSTIEGLGFCIPINDVSSIITDLIEYGKVVNKAYMGVSISDISDVMVKQYNMVKGAYVYSVEKDSSAEKAGLKTGDIIVELGGKKVENSSELLSAKRSYKSGDTANIKIWRSGEYLDLSITFDEQIEEIISNNIEENQNNYYNYGNQNNNNYNNNDMFNEFFNYYFGR